MQSTSLILSAIALFTISSACGSEAETSDMNMNMDAGADASGPSTEEVDALTEAAFTRDRVLQINIEVEEEDWDSMRHETRDLISVLGSTCEKSPPLKPYSYYPADVTIDGERVANVGIRKKGFFGSLDTQKPSIKIKFSEYVSGQRFSGLQRMTLNNSKSDKGYLNQCLGYDLFRGLGMPAPRCNFANVSINGQVLGLFIHVESVKRQFLRQHFTSEDGNLYEGALSDFRSGWVNSFERKTNKDTSSERSDIEAIGLALVVANDDLEASIDSVIDLEKYLDFWALETLIGHSDGYARNSNNFYTYFDPLSGKGVFIPWGIDSIFRYSRRLPWERADEPASIWATAELPRRLNEVPSLRARYFARLQSLLDQAWNEPALQASVDTMATLIDPYVLSSERDTFDSAVLNLRGFIDNSRARLEGEMISPPVLTHPPRDSWCLEQLGTISSTFSTTFGTLGAADPWSTGSAEVELDISTNADMPGQIASLAGFDEDTGKPVVQILLSGVAPHIVVAQFLLSPQNYIAGATTTLDVAKDNAYLVDINYETGEIDLLGIIAEGMITFSAASTEAGMVVSGSVSSPIYEEFSWQN